MTHEFTSNSRTSVFISSSLQSEFESSPSTTLLHSSSLPLSSPGGFVTWSLSRSFTERPGSRQTREREKSVPLEVNNRLKRLPVEITRPPPTTYKNSDLRSTDEFLSLWCGGGGHVVVSSGDRFLSEMKEIHSFSGHLSFTQSGLQDRVKETRCPRDE